MKLNKNERELLQAMVDIAMNTPTRTRRAVYQPRLRRKGTKMFILIETIHTENAWWNTHEEFDTAELAIMAALACPSSSSVEVVDTQGNVILPLQYGQGE